MTNAGAEAGLEEAQTEISSSDNGLEAPPSPEAISFSDLGLSPEILRAVAESGYTTPTPIQAQGIPHVLAHRDVIGIAQTGTGKTASFTLPMIDKLARGRAKARMPRSLILEPTRELAAQVAESFERYGKYNKLSMALLIGGVSFDDQDKKIDRGVDVLIATPGRLLDHVGRGKLILSQVQILVIDEADRMLDMGFIPDVEEICKKIPFTRQTLFYSATMPPEIRRLTDQFLQSPVRVEVSRPATTASNIVQEIIEVPANDWAKREVLRILVRENEVKNGIVFCNRKRDVDIVAKSLKKHGFNAAPLHGDLDQSLRTKTLDGFRNGEIALLVASDVAARGLDIPAVSHIFNFDVPFHADDYVHRIGRTGRAGRSGHAFMLATPRDSKSVEAIERLTKLPIAKRKIDVEVREDRNPPRNRDRGRGAKGKSDGRNRPPPQHGQFANEHPATPVVAAPTNGAANGHSTTGHLTNGQSANAPVRPQAQQRPAQTQKPQKQQQQQPRASTPDADSLPAFLLRPVNFPKPEKPAPRAKKEAEPTS